MSQPRTFCITMAGSERWPARVDHFAKVGLAVEAFRALDGPRSGLLTGWCYEIDHPKSGYKIGPKTIGIAMSHIMVWTTLRHLPEDYWMVLEDDALLDADWESRLGAALKDVPDNWDMLYAGSCNCFDKPKLLVAGDVYKILWPQCTHCYLVRKKALDVLLDSNVRIWAPIDCALVHDSFPKLNIYTVLPRIVSQDGTDIYP